MILMVFKIGFYMIVPPNVIECDVRPCGLPSFPENSQMSLHAETPKCCKGRGALVSLL